MLPPVAVKLTLLITHVMFGAEAVTAATGLDKATTACDAVLVHPAALVAVTVYVPAVVTVMALVVAPLLHR